MIPQGGSINQQIYPLSQPSRTYRLDRVSNRIIGYVDDLEAVQQAVYKIMQTERFEHFIYGTDYGSEITTLIGRSKVYIQSEVSRRIQEALLQDDRIRSVGDFSVEVSGDTALVNFTVVSTFGSFQTQKEV